MSTPENQFPKQAIPELDALAPPKLKQRHLLQTREYELGLDGVTVTESDIIGWNKLKIRFETINDDPIEVKSSSKSAFWATVVFLALVAMSLVNLAFDKGANTNAQAAPYIYGFFAILTGVCFFLTRRQYFVFGSLNFYRDIRTKNKVLEFMGKVRVQKMDYFNKHLITQLGNDTSVNDIARLFWLKEHGVVTEDEFNKLKAGVVRRTELGNTEPPSKN